MEREVKISKIATASNDAETMFKLSKLCRIRRIMSPKVKSIEKEILKKIFIEKIKARVRGIKKEDNWKIPAEVIVSG